MLVSANAEAGEEGQTILIRRGNTAVTVEDLKQELSLLPDNQGDAIYYNMEKLSTVVNNLYLRKMLASEAVEKKLDEDPKFSFVLNRLRNRALADMAVEKRLAAEAEKISVRDYELRAKELYRLEPEKYLDKPRIRASHILIKTGERTRELAFQAVLDIRRQLMAGESFDELALARSEDASAKEKMGDLGYFTEAEMVPTFAAAAFGLKELGEISFPIETEFGFHIIKLTDKKKIDVLPFEQVKEGIISSLKDNATGEIRRQIMKSIAADPEIEIFKDRILALKREFPKIERIKK